MTSAIVKQDGDWNQERVELVKRTICPKGITNDEFALFIEQCKRSGLDPLLKEAFCVPRKKNIGSKERPEWVTVHEFQPSEGGMLVRAERFPDYLGIAASAVYSNDRIEIDAGVGAVSHVYSPTKARGTLVGAWSRLERAGKTAIVVWLDLAAYAQNTATWGKMPATMIEKCARVGALRKAYPSAFGGLYIREEMEGREGFEEPAAPTLTAQAAPAVAGRRTAEVRAQLAARTARVEVLPPTSPAARAMRVVEVKDGETEKDAEARQVEPDWFGRIRDLGASFGYEKQKLSSFVKSCGIPKTKPETFTAADFETVAGAFKALHPAAALTPDEEPPPPDDKDAPWMAEGVP